MAISEGRQCIGSSAHAGGTVISAGSRHLLGKGADTPFALAGQYQDAVAYCLAGDTQRKRAGRYRRAARAAASRALHAIRHDFPAKAPSRGYAIRNTSRLSL